MNLNCMSLEDLISLQNGLYALVDAGHDLRKRGFEPEFNLTPGQRVTISLPALIGPDDDRIPTAEMMAGLVRSVPGPCAFPAQNTDIGIPIPVVAEAAPPPPPALRDSAGEGDRGSILSGASEPLILPKAPRLQPKPGKRYAFVAAAWTAAEDADIIAQIVASMRAGALITHAYDKVSIAGRTPAAIRYRATHKLLGPIADAIKEIGKPEVKVVQAQTASPVPLPKIEKAVSVAEPQKPVEKIDLRSQRPPVTLPAPLALVSDASTPIWLRTLRAHLDLVGFAEPWTAALDLDMVKGLFSGQSLATFAEKHNLPLLAVKDRFFALREPVLDRGMMTIDGQKHLLIGLQERVVA